LKCLLVLLILFLAGIRTIAQDEPNEGALVIQKNETNSQNKRKANSFLLKAFDACYTSSTNSKDYRLCAKEKVKPCRCKEFSEGAITFSCNIITANIVVFT